MKQRQVSMSGVVRRQPQELQEEATKAGRGQRFAHAARQILKALQSHPLPPAAVAFGCPRYHLHQLRLLVCGAVVAPVAVRFAATDVPVESNGADPTPAYVIGFDLLV
jgi:hypothetical protein